jgi:hypothetical protein
MIASRAGEKLGWLGGWAGGFLWVLALAVLFLLRGQLVDGLVGLALVGLGYGAVVFFRPWRFPETRYWRLLILPYIVMFAAVPWAIWSFSAESAEDLSWWQLLPLLAVLSPFATIGWRRWRDG